MASPEAQTDPIRFGPFEFDRVNLELRKCGYVVKLPPQPLAVLRLMVESAGKVVTRDEIRRHIWKDDTFVDFEGGINFAISQIREALGDDPAKPRFIETIPRRGYRFLCAAQVGSGGANTIKAPLVRNRLRSLAVLPFTNGTGAEEAEYLSEGISASIINLLSQFPDLRVVPRTSAFRYSGRETDLKRVARDLNADFVLTGTVVQRSDRILVQAELVDIAKDAQLWGGQYNRGIEDVFTLQEELGRRISESLGPNLANEEDQFLTRRPTENREAYLLYLKAVYYANKWTPHGVQQGIAYSRQAIEADPLFARAYSTLAYLYVLMCTFGGVPPLQAFPLARAAVFRALEIDETVAEAHACQAYIMLAHDWNFAAAERESRRAIELAPNIPDGHFVRSQWCLVTGLSEQAIAEAQTALELDPLSIPNHTNLALIYHKLGKYEAAIEQLQRALAIDSSFTPARSLLALSYAHSGRDSAAFAELEKVPAPSGGATRTDITSDGVRGVIFALSGKHTEARAVLAQLGLYSRPPDFVSALECAYIHAFLGDTAQSVEWLDRALQGRAPTLFYIRKPNHPVAEILRQDPRFGDLLDRMGHLEAFVSGK